jgi:hypothetical protein
LKLPSVGWVHTLENLPFTTPLEVSFQKQKCFCEVLCLGRIYINTISIMNAIALLSLRRNVLNLRHVLFSYKTSHFNVFFARCAQN